MRDIIFRGKRTANGEWVEGYYAIRNKRPVIYSGRVNVKESSYIGHGLYEEYECDERFAVDPDTVCEWTGLTDKNGKKIFEDDIVLVSGKHVDHVIFSSGCFCMENQMIFYEFTYQCEDSLEVIGNIYDNPDLIKR